MDEIKQVFREFGFTVEEDRLPEAVVYSVARTFNLFAREFAQAYKRFGLTPASFNLLLLLQNGEEKDTFTQHRVGELLVVTPSNMSGLIDRMEQKGRVRRVPGPDRRSKILQITPKGTQLLEQVWPHHEEVVKRLPKALNYEETKTLVKMLARMRHSLAA